MRSKDDTKAKLTPAVGNTAQFARVIEVELRAIADSVLDAVEPPAELGTVERDLRAERQKIVSDYAGAGLLTACRLARLCIASARNGEVLA